MSGQGVPGAGAHSSSPSRRRPSGPSDAGSPRCEPWADPSTIAFGIEVPAPLGDELILSALTDTDGTAIAVDDEEMLVDLASFGRLEGLLLCPEGAAALTAVRMLRQQGWLAADDRVVVLNTGAGIKYPLDLGT